MMSGILEPQWWQAPRLTLVPGKDVVDMDTLKAVVVSRVLVLANYAREVLAPVTRMELCDSERACRKGLGRY